MALGCNAFSIPSILGTSVVQSGAHCMFIGDARRGSYWISRLGGKRLVSEPALCDESGLCSALAECERSAHLVFTFEESAKFKVLDPGCRIEKVVPHATWLWNCWDLGDDAIRHKWFSEAPQPIYLKPPHITPARTTRLQ